MKAAREGPGKLRAPFGAAGRRGRPLVTPLGDVSMEALLGLPSSSLPPGTQGLGRTHRWDKLSRKPMKVTTLLALCLVYESGRA